MKFGIRIHGGIYSIWHRGAESWPFLTMSLDDRQAYNNLYKAWNPAGFDADSWMTIFEESGLKMFAFTSKHHEGFSMFDTKTRVKSRVNWTAPGWPAIEECDLAYSIMETPFKRDIVKELCDAAHKRNIKIDLYFSHPDWYDADFRPYVTHPLQTISSAQGTAQKDFRAAEDRFGNHLVVAPETNEAEVAHDGETSCAAHRAAYELWPDRHDVSGYEPRAACLARLRKTLMKMRELQPDVMLRNRGIDNYGDYYTPERVVPGSNEASEKPWFCIYPLGSDFSYEPDAAKHKGTEWIVTNLVDTVAKGGGLMIGVGPSPRGEFIPRQFGRCVAQENGCK